MRILHGDNIAASRLSLIDLEKQFKAEVVQLDAKTCTLTDIIQAVESFSLFGTDRLVVLENLLSNKKTQKETLDYLKKNQPGNLIIWEGKELSKTDLAAFPDAKPQLFKIDKTLFKLMEALRPRNVKNLLLLYDQTLQTEDPELIFSMLIRQFRLLILVKLEPDEPSEDYKKLQSWQKSRLTGQANYFTIDALRKIYEELLQIDIKNKTSSSAMDLQSQLEFFLVKL